MDANLQKLMKSASVEIHNLLENAPPPVMAILGVFAATSWQLDGIPIKRRFRLQLSRNNMHEIATLDWWERTDDEEHTRGTIIVPARSAHCSPIALLEKMAAAVNVTVASDRRQKVITRADSSLRGALGLECGEHIIRIELNCGKGR